MLAPRLRTAEMLWADSKGGRLYSLYVEWRGKVGRATPGRTLRGRR